MVSRIRCALFFLFFPTFFWGLSFAQQEPSLDLGPIVVTKSRVHLLTPYSLEAEELEIFGFSSPLEALRLLPLDLQSRSPYADIQTDFSLRGSTFQGVLMLMDGLRINDPQTGHHTGDIPLTKEDIERIEVIAGVGSSVFGPDALGGAVNILVKKAAEKKRVLELGIGGDQAKAVLMSVSEKKDNLGVRLSLENREYGGFYYDTDFKKFTTALNSSLEIPDGEFELGMGYLEKEFGAYDFYTPAKGYPSKEWTKTFLLNSGFNLDKEGFIIKPDFLWRRHYDKFMLDKTQVRSRSLNHHRSDVYAPSFYLQKETPFLGRVGLGLEYREERINSTNLGKHNRQQKSIFLDESKDLLPGLSLGLSWRRDDFDGFGSTYTGSSTLRYKLLEGHSLYWGLSRSIRVPSFTELYYNDPTTQGDASLSAEEAGQYQLGYDYEKENFSWGAAIFFRQEKDLIDWVKRTSSQARWQVENITEAEVKGLENYLKIRLNEYLDLNSNYTYVDKRINDRGYLYKYGANYIRHLLNHRLSFKFPFGVQGLGLSYKKKPNRDGWFILDAHLSLNLPKKIQLFLKITNLLNVEYQQIEGIPQPGRNLEAGIRFAW